MATTAEYKKKRGEKRREIGVTNHLRCAWKEWAKTVECSSGAKKRLAKQNVGLPSFLFRLPIK